MEHLFNKTCDIFLYQKRDEWNMEEVYLRRGTTKCRLRLLNSNEIIEGKKKKVATHRVYLPITAKMDHSDRLLIDSIWYEIISIVNNAGGNANHHIEVDVIKHDRQINI